MNEGNRKISGMQGFLIIFTALAIDVVQIIIEVMLPAIGSVINMVISICAGVMFALWFLFLGIKSTRVYLGLFGTTGFEWIPMPFLSAVPAWTAFAIILVIMDFVKSKIKKTLIKKGVQAII